MLQRLQTEIAHRGFYSFKVNATDFLDPYDPSVRSKPELYEVAMNSQLSSQLSDSTVATIGGRASPYLLPPKPPCSYSIKRAAFRAHSFPLPSQTAKTYPVHRIVLATALQRSYCGHKLEVEHALVCFLRKSQHLAHAA